LGSGGIEAISDIATAALFAAILEALWGAVRCGRTFDFGAFDLGEAIDFEIAF